VKNAESVEERNRLFYILLALVITIVTGMTDLVQKLGIPVPPLGHIGSVIGPSILVVGVLRHRKAYDVLAQAQMKLEMLSDVARGVTHEVRNPLSAIKGLVNLQANYLKKLDTEKIVEYQDILTEEIQRMEMILAGFQDFSKPLELERESIDINNLVEKTFKLVILDPLNVWITLDLSPDIPKVQMDPSLLRQVFLNLIKNASEACGKEGKLEIRTEHSSSWVKIRFTDNGPGISEEILDRIFEPFFSTKKTGIGLGLSIVRKIMDTHGGHIEITSVSPNGAKITLVLPT
jgi:signal transduction histidine kinase